MIPNRRSALSLRDFTTARVALGRVGDSLPTQELLAFQLAHARARDAVHATLDALSLALELKKKGWDCLTVRTAARNRAEYLRRPDLGRRLADDVSLFSGDYEACIVICDGLSALAVDRHAIPLLDAFLPALIQADWKIAPLVIAMQARVAIGDAVGAKLNANLAVVLIGERPGLSSPDSLGVYLTWDPKPGRNDAERNCLSNIRPEGLSYELAAHKLRYLMTEARRRRVSGVTLKEDAGAGSFPYVYPESRERMPNHLISEKSPYLLQHAHNPVNWRPWNEEAFETARREDKPIFLSIGYSTCHWCHVMERESFENEKIASVLNEYFVPIKVDREERPDVDRIYMSFVQATTGSGGWPMSVFLTPDLKPFFGGTYFPPDNRYGRPGFLAVLQSLTTSWYTEREKINQSSADVIAHLAQAIDSPEAKGAILDNSILEAGFNYFRRTYDSTYGGFGSAPKFPRPVVFEFLLRYYARTRNAEALEMTVKTLRAMAEGGMNDQLGGGFHRYSVDETWFLPHFEKMLYDQAQLAAAFVQAFQITQDPFYAQVARNTLDYVLRDLTYEGGGFYSAEDADSVIDPGRPHEKGEGAFYVWTRQEIDSILGAPAAEAFASYYGVEAGGNVHNDPHGEFPGKNILFIRRTSKPESEMNLKESAAKLLKARSARVRPHLDDKILTAWNGLMISAFAKAAQVLDEPRYAAAASRAAAFILTRMYNPAARTLLRRYRDQDAAIPGFLDDYAFFAQALLDLYETDFAPARLEIAAGLLDKMLELFEDRENGGFFATAARDPTLVMRLKDDYDGAEPSGNAVALLALLRMEQFTHRQEYADAAERTLHGLAGRLIGQPAAAPLLLAGLDHFQSAKRQVIISGSADDPRTTAMLRAVRSHFSPNSVTMLTNSNEQAGGPPTASVCENFVCKLPVSDVEKLTELLQ